VKVRVRVRSDQINKGFHQKRIGCRAPKADTSHEAERKADRRPMLLARAYRARAPPYPEGTSRWKQLSAGLISRRVIVVVDVMNEKNECAWG